MGFLESSGLKKGEEKLASCCVLVLKIGKQWPTEELFGIEKPGKFKFDQ